METIKSILEMSFRGKSNHILGNNVYFSGTTNVSTTIIGTILSDWKTIFNYILVNVYLKQFPRQMFEEFCLFFWTFAKKIF